MAEAGLTCPQCCYDALTKIEENEWKCENCGTSFNFGQLRKLLNDLVGCQFTEDFISELLGDPVLRRYQKLGERGWEWVGKHGTLHTLHVGNTWHVIIKGAK